jgi:hypothetical protein
MFRKRIGHFCFHFYVKFAILYSSSSGTELTLFLPLVTKTNTVPPAMVEAVLFIYGIRHVYSVT